ncbi:MAG TPA: dethiobiotin synthase [Lacipirellulaceae bacterium]|nr:dethiobiotin synthase [Lacipirellulaceae bacterium]
MAQGLFVTGTGTGVGKTYVAALIAGALRNSGKRAGVYKPVASGCEFNNEQLMSPDALALWEAAGRPGTLEQVCPQRFAAPLAPHRAARAEGRRVDPQLLRDGINFWRETSDFVLVEGAGGLMSPLSDEDYNADLAAEFGYPLLIVSANVLGTINATLQTLITADAYGRAGSTEQGAGSKRSGALIVRGVVLNSPAAATDASAASNADELTRRCGVPLLATVEHGGRFDRDVDWMALCGI